MAYAKRRMYKRKRPVGRPRRKTYRRSKFTKPRSLPSMVHRFKRGSDQVYDIAQFSNTTNTWVSTGGVRSDFSVSATTERNMFLIGFRLDDVPNDSEFTNLFRYYKITGVKITLVFPFNSATATSGLPYVMHSWAPDMNESDAPTTYQQLRERANMRRRYVSANKRRISMYYRPHVLNRIVDIDGNELYAQARGTGWITTNSTTMVHSGVLIAIDNTQGQEMTVGLETTYYFQCKGLQ